uniref:SAGA-associated factor 29 n=1 Tax=Ascaris suum TaxID=6253 RepID=F1LB77_ASCSU
MPAPRVTRKQSGEFSKEEEKIRLVLQEINSKLKTVVQNKENVNAALTPIQSLIDRNKLSIGCKLSGPLRGKVIAMYTNAKKACEEEEQLLRKLLSKIDEIHNMQYQMRRTSQMRRGALMQLLMYHARTMRLWIGPLDTHPPALVGAIGYPDSLPIKVGSEVAAFVSDIWMLAEVVSVNASGVYEVKDVDDEQKAKYTVRRSRLIPLPIWRADPLRDGHALFPVNAIVLALYPQTTCFYKGVVERVPEKASDDYLVAFEDSSFAQGFSPPLPVPQRFIIAHKIPRPYKRKANHSCDED